MAYPISDSQVRFAIDATREAALLVRRIQREMVVGALAKNDKSPVTVADFAAQAVVAKRLADAFPAAVLVGEESSEALRSAEGRETLEQITGFVQTVFPDATAETVCDWIDTGAGEAPGTHWTLDPVDGTKGFLRGDQYAVALAYIEDGKVLLGALGCPELNADIRPAKGQEGAVLAAKRGEGCFASSLDGDSPWKQLSVSPQTDVTQARLLRSVEKAHTSTGGIADLVNKLGIEAEPVPLDSQAKYAVLASGGGEVNIRLISPSRPDYREKIWDQAAGSIVVEEAGGVVTDLDGKSLDFSHGRTLAKNRGIVATNGPIQEQLLAAIRSIGA